MPPDAAHDADWTRTRCVELLNDANLASDADATTSALKQVVELVTSHAGARDASLSDVIDAVLEFRAAPAVATRKYIAGMCETIGKAREDALGACIDAARGMVRDDSAIVAKRASAACGQTFREALIVAAVKGNAPRVLKHVTAAWVAAKAAMEDVAGVLCAPGGNDGVKMQCAKTVEAAILSLAGEGWGSNIVKVGHKTLNLEEMMSDGVVLAERLHEALRGVSEGTKPTGPLALVLVAALGNVCVKKAELATGCTPVLIEYAKSHVTREREDVAANGRASATNASVSKELKTVLLDVLRNGPTQAVEGGMMNELSTICRELGAGDAVDSALRHRERTAHALGEKRASFLSPAGNLKRARMREREYVAPPPPPPLMPLAPMTDPNILRQILVTLAALANSPDRNMLDAFVTQLAPPALADAILANLEHLPPASQFYLASRANAQRPPPPPPMAAAAAMGPVVPEPEDTAEPLSVIVRVEELNAEVAEAFRLEAIQRMLAVGTMAEEYGGAEKLTLSGPLRSSLLARLAAAGAAKSSGASMEEETLAIASALLFTADGGGVYELEGVHMLMKWLTTLYAQEIAYDFSYVPYEHAISAAIECLTRGVAGATSTTAIASGAKKPLSQLLCDVPALPGAVWRAFRIMCRLDTGSEDGEDDTAKFPTTEETVTLILSVLQDIILERPPSREDALELCLECATCNDEAVRGKAIRLIANRLHPVKHLAQNIEAYAKAGLERGRTIGLQALEDAKALVQRDAAVKEEAVEDEGDDGAAKDDADAMDATDAAALVEIAEKVDHIAKAGDTAVGPMLLYCALCARNYALLPGLFEAYASLDEELRLALHRPVNGLARAVGPNCLELCEIIASPPEGSLPLVVECLETLASISSIPAPTALLDAAEALCESQNKDVAYLAPLVCSFDEERIRDLLPQFIKAGVGIFSSVLDALLSVPEDEAVLSPVAIFIAVHEVQTGGDSGVNLKQLVDACSTCFERPDVFTPQVLASAMQQMVEQTPLPLLFMRTVIQAETVAPQLKEFTLGLLRTLVNRQVWKMDKSIWEGFLRCAKRAAPRSFPLFTDLPATTLADVLAKFGDAFKDALSQYANNPSVASTIPKAIAALLS